MFKGTGMKIDCAEITITIINYEEIMANCELIIESCIWLNVAEYQMERWISKYLSENIKVEV